MNLNESHQKLFPLRSELEVINYFEQQIYKAKELDDEPNLTLFSIILGYIEHELTQTKIISDQSSSTESEQEADKLKWKSDLNLTLFPEIRFDIIEPLYNKFKVIIKGTIDKSLPENTTRAGLATREVCRRITNVIWNRLYPNYHKDKAHIQSMFSFLTNRQLDCFGLAFSVVCAGQILSYNDIHLALSEDHAWVKHGDNDMTEVTWHGKGNEDKRGFAITKDTVSKNWVYVNGEAVVCDRWSELAAIITAINPAIDLHTESEELARIHHKLLQIMYKYHALDNYPMALNLLAEYECSPAISCNESGIPPPIELFSQSIESVQTIYKNQHILPYCSKGNFFLHQGKGLEAIKCWSNAAQVLSNYNYTREDEEIYKEFREIASDLIPQALRTDENIATNKEAFKQVTKFYDGVCLWEEGSPTPVLHSWWAKYFVHAMSRFSATVRISFRRDISSDSDENCNEPIKENTLGMKSEKMTGLCNVICKEKINTQAVSLQLTAQSQVNFEKRKTSTGDYSIEYGSNSKRKRKSRVFD